MKAKLYRFLVCLFCCACSKDKEVQTQITTEIGTIYYCSRLISGGSWQVLKKDLTTNAITIITSDAAYNYWWVELSPNKTQLLLLRSPINSPKDQFDYANCELIKCNADGSNSQVIIADNQNGWFAFGNPHWHPSGNRILLIAQASNDTAPFFIYSVDVNGNNPNALTTQYSLDANWSPDGNKITFVGINSTGFVDATSFEIFTANYDFTSNTLSAIQQITSDNTRNHDPCFSPDGTIIAFSAGNAALTNADIVKVESSGQNRAIIVNDSGIHGGPLNWGNDGKIYHHSIYLGITNFRVNAFNTISNTHEIILSSTSNGFISPFYVN